MSALPDAADSPTADSGPRLRPQLDPRWALRAEHLLVILVCGLVFLLFNYLPLRSTDLWGHAAYGRWIIEHRELPQADPFMPLAEGVRVVDGAWLSQVIFALAEGEGGIAGAERLSHLFGLVMTATFFIWLRVFNLQTGRPLLALLGMVLVLAVGWSRLTTIRPENFGALCFALQFWLLVPRSSEENAEPAARTRFDWPLWIATPLLFALWANLHGSFVCGLAVLGCLWAGRLLEVAWRTRGARAIWQDIAARRALLMLELAFLATLLNPYGIGLHYATLTFGGNPNLRDVLEWQPLLIIGVGGREFAVSLVLLLIVLRHSRRPLPASHVLLLAVFGVAAVFGIRMLGWYAPIFAYVMMPQLDSVLTRLGFTKGSESSPAEDLAAEPSPQAEAVPALRVANIADAADEEDEGLDDDEETDDEEEQEYVLPPGRSFKYSLIGVLLVWIAFAFSPLSRGVLGGKERQPGQIYEDQTSPLAVTEYLRRNPPTGMIFAPQHWADWLDREVGQDFTPLVTSQIHLVPPTVWRDYNRIVVAQAGWEAALDRYRIDTVILSRDLHVSLERVLRTSDDWTVAFEDEQAMVVKRVAGRKVASG